MAKILNVNPQVKGLTRRALRRPRSLAGPVKQGKRVWPGQMVWWLSTGVGRWRRVAGERRLLWTAGPSWYVGIFAEEYPAEAMMGRLLMTMVA